MAGLRAPPGMTADGSLGGSMIGHGPTAVPGWAVLDDGLRAKVAETAITGADIEVAQTCLHALAKVVSEFGAGWSVHPFGSISNGFAKHGSDVDATVCKEGQEAPEFSAHEVQEQIIALLRHHADFQIVQEVKTARIPILRLRYQKVLDVDLSFLNKEPLPNTQLLRAYAALGQLARDLGVLVKLWANAVGICGAQKGHLSAYAFTLMALYFMQVDPAVSLPALDTSLFTGSRGVPPGARPPWRCELSQAALLCRFFSFYAGEFQWGSEVVSVRTGRRAASSDEDYGQLRGRMTQRLHIEDPFLPGRNLHCVLKNEQEGYLYQKIWEAAQAMQHGVMPMGLESSARPPARGAFATWLGPDMPHDGPDKRAGGLGPPAADRTSSSDREPGSDESTRVSGVSAATAAELVGAESSDADGQAEGSGPKPSRVPPTRLRPRWLF